MINNKLQTKKNSKGFTIVEMLIVTAIFSSVMITIGGLFASALQVEKNVLGSKKVLGQISYAAEYMTRALRMAERDETGACIAANSNYDTSNGIKFINVLQDDECQQFYLENKKIKTKYYPSLEVIDLTSSEIFVDKLEFVVSGDILEDNAQPFVTIYIEAHTGDSPKLKVQTSVSQRNMDY